MIHLLWGLVAVFSLLAGGYIEQLRQELREGSMAFYCTDSPKYSTYIAKEGADFVCFKQNIVNKKISKSLIVESKE